MESELKMNGKWIENEWKVNWKWMESELKMNGKWITLFRARLQSYFESEERRQNFNEISKVMKQGADTVVRVTWRSRVVF